MSFNRQGQVLVLTAWYSMQFVRFHVETRHISKNKFDAGRFFEKYYFLVIISLLAACRITIF